MTSRQWLIVSGGDIVGRASVTVRAEDGLLVLDCDPLVESAARRAVEQALRADLQISNLVEEHQ